MDEVIKKAILPVAGMGTRFLPLAKAMPKEMWPIVDKPAIQFIVEEARDSGIENIIFVNNKRKKIITDYFKSYPEALKKILKSRKKQEALGAIQQIEDLVKKVSFSSVLQDKPLGDGHAILQAAPKIGKESVAVLFGDDIVESKTPCLKQLMDIFKTCQRPVLALYRMPKNLLPSYGVVGVEKIANRVFKIKKIVEKPEPGKEPSDLAIVGKYILTPDVFDFLKKAKPSKKGEIILANVFIEMLEQGKSIYGYEFEGKWLECGNKMAWLKSDLYLTLQDPRFSEELKNFIRENKLL
ncbi:UTP--glucose-1-phosphate uridylyltransferase [Patescibacteria group bacterium]|nr:UTP--glucose-1-phosphate uridylyltransferase [Patescibacteria group bacterium]MBU4023292.1 UTP--glucose-1-phosphate uridylyltransferase [Patescibacteria group bacterium]MBU4078132.1 UTP--glucose-1-phosphate uridylyltransferase [Patescibacteria group bacterium]